MNPWLLAVIALGLGGFALASRKAPTTSPFLPPTPPQPGPANALAPTNILQACQYALAHETDPVKLTSFGHALLAYGVTGCGQQLLAKAAALSQGATSSAKQTAAWKAEQASLSPDAFGASTFNPSQASLNQFINHYIGTKLGPVDKATAEQVKQAAAFAMAHEKDGHALILFANYLTQYGDPQYFKAMEAQGTALEAEALKPWVKKFAGMANVTSGTLDHAINVAKLHGDPADLIAFGQALEGFTDFGRNWDEDGKALVAQGQHGGH